MIWTQHFAAIAIDTSKTHEQRIEAFDCARRFRYGWRPEPAPVEKPQGMKIVKSRPPKAPPKEDERHLLAQHERQRRIASEDSLVKAADGLRAKSYTMVATLQMLGVTEAELKIARGRVNSRRSAQRNKERTFNAGAVTEEK